jgi:hypothetical protein
MKLQQTAARGDAIGRRAAAEITERIVRNANVPSDVAITKIDGGIVITGKRLRSRWINDPALRNFAHD